MRAVVAVILLVAAIASAIYLGGSARLWNAELELAPALATMPPRVDDPRTPRLARRVILVIVDGLGAAESKLPFLDELRARGASTTAQVPYPTISRPNYVTILTGVPPADSGVRTNRVDRPVAIDTLMDRVQAARLRVASLSNLGTLVSLFLRGTSTIRGHAFEEAGERLRPPAPLHWPVDDARRARGLPAFESTLAELASSDAALVVTLVGDVDKVGHRFGVAATYRQTARDVDAALARALETVDLAQDTIVVTADHGHVGPGGHGGREPEVSTVPLVLAGAGIVPGATARDAQLVDVSPTLAALLGVTAPGHASGRTLTELLALPPELAARRSAVDDARRAAVATRVVRGPPGPSPPRLALVLGGAAFVIGVAWVLRRRDVIRFAPACVLSLVAFFAIIGAMLVVTRGHPSPSYVPSVPGLTKVTIVAGSTGIVAQLVAMRWGLREMPRELHLALVDGHAFGGLAALWLVVGLMRSWFYPPHHDVPEPLWMVAVPALELAAAIGCVAIAVVLLYEIVLRRAITHERAKTRSEKRCFDGGLAAD